MDISALKSFQFLKHLSDQQLILLVNNSEILKLKKGEQLLEAGDEDEEDQQNLGGDIGSQVTAQPKALLIGAALLTGFALIPGFPTFIFLGFAAVIGAGGVYLIKRNQEAVQTVETLPEVLSKGSGAAATSSAESKKAA